MGIKYLISSLLMLAGVQGIGRVLIGQNLDGVPIGKGGHESTSHRAHEEVIMGQNSPSGVLTAT